MALLDHVEVVSPTEAKVVLTKPSNSWLYNMAGTVGIMFDTDGVADLANTPSARARSRSPSACRATTSPSPPAMTTGARRRR